MITGSGTSTTVNVWMTLWTLRLTIGSTQYTVVPGSGLSIRFEMRTSAGSRLTRSTARLKASTVVLQLSLPGSMNTSSVAALVIEVWSSIEAAVSFRSTVAGTPMIAVRSVSLNVWRTESIGWSTAT